MKVQSSSWPSTAQRPGPCSKTVPGCQRVTDAYQGGERAPLPFYTPEFLSCRPAQNTAESIAKIQAQLDREWKFFGQQTYDIEGRLIRQGFSEEQDEVYKRVGYFWETGTGFALDGRDREWPWSAAFISAVHQDAGVGPQFLRSPAHARYIRDAIFKKQAGAPAAYWGYRITERAPQVGDMVCYSRQNGVDYDRQPLRYKSHADIVTAVRPGEIDVVGGNVGHSVSKRTLRTDENGLLIDETRNWFAVLAPQDLSGAFLSPPPEPDTPFPDYAG